MRPTLVLSLLAAAGLIVTPACRREEPPAAVAPASGWSADDTRVITADLSAALASHAWAGQFREAKGHAPVIEIRLPEDRSGDRVPVAAVESGFQQALAGTDRVHAANQGEVADVALTTIIGLRQIAGKAYFTVDARIEDLRTGDRLWIGGLERQRQAPAPAAR